MSEATPHIAAAAGEGGGEVVPAMPRASSDAQHAPALTTSKTAQSQPPARLVPNTLARALGTARSPAACLTLIGVMVLSIFTDLATKHIVFMGFPPLSIPSVVGYPVPIERQDVLVKSLEDPRLVTTLIPRHMPQVVVPNLLEFTLVLNPGAIFGIGPGQRWFFVGFSLLALAFGLWMFLRWTGPKDRWAHVGIAMLLGGGFGNLYDRLVYGCVRDFIHPLPGVKWPFGFRPMGGDGDIWPYVSNLADLYLLIGILILLAVLWHKDRTAQKHARRAKSQPA